MVCWFIVYLKLLSFYSFLRRGEGGGWVREFTIGILKVVLRCTQFNEWSVKYSIHTPTHYFTHSQNLHTCTCKSTKLYMKYQHHAVILPNLEHWTQIGTPWKLFKWLDCLYFFYLQEWFFSSWENSGYPSISNYCDIFLVQCSKLGGITVLVKKKAVWSYLFEHL